MPVVDIVFLCLAAVALTGFGGALAWASWEDARAPREGAADEGGDAVPDQGCPPPPAAP